jgi:hypothetical protein
MRFLLFQWHQQHEHPRRAGRPTGLPRGSADSLAISGLWWLKLRPKVNQKLRFKLTHYR